MTQTIAIIVVVIVVCLIVAVSAILFLRKRKKHKPTEIPQSKLLILLHTKCFNFKVLDSNVCSYSLEDADENSTVDSLQYPFSTVKAATNDFSDNNKLGQGGFGTVYKVDILHIYRSEQQ